MDTEISKGFLAKLAEMFGVDAKDLQSDFKVADRWDSVVVLSMIALIDEEFDVTVPVDDLTGCTSVADVLALVSDSIDQRSPRR